MMYKNFQILILIMLMMGSTLAGDKIKLKLQQPPPNKMPVTSLWKMDIENLTKEAITIYLLGTASGDRQGEIVSGTTRTFNVKPGKSTYGYEDFKSGDVKWVNKSIQEIIIRTGEVPEDNYTICVTAYYEDGKVADNQQCITHQVIISTGGTIALVAPEEDYVLQATGNIDRGGGVDEEQMAALNNLMWTSSSIPQDGFSIKFVEMKSGQSPEEAMNSNITFFKQDGIRTNTLKYPLLAPRFKVGSKYAWQVSSGYSKSDVWSFSIKQVGNIVTEDCQLPCQATLKNIYRNWTFGNHGGLLFPQTGDPVSVQSQIDAAEGCASISDNNGQLLFYSDGTNVFDGNHNQICGDLLGQGSSTQSVLIVPKPSTTNKYIIITYSS